MLYLFLTGSYFSQLSCRHLEFKSALDRSNFLPTFAPSLSPMRSFRDIFSNDLSIFLFIDTSLASRQLKETYRWIPVQDRKTYISMILSRGCKFDIIS